MGADELLVELMTESGRRLLRLAYQLTRDQASAEDVVQEALTRMYQSWRRRTPELVEAEAYAKRAVVNEYLRRRRQRSSTEVVSAAPPEQVATAFEDGLVDRDALWQALGGLSSRQRAVLVLRYYEQLPDAQIAELLGVKDATVRSLALRGLTSLRSAHGVLEGS